MSEFGRINPTELDRYITGNWGEDSVSDDPPDKQVLIESMLNEGWLTADEAARIAELSQEEVLEIWTTGSSSSGKSISPTKDETIEIVGGYPEYPPESDQDDFVEDEPPAESGGLDGDCPDCGGSGIVGSWETLTILDSDTGEVHEVTGMVDRKCETCVFGDEDDKVRGPGWVQKAMEDGEPSVDGPGHTWRYEG